MAIHWGVDSLNRSDKPCRGAKTLWDYVVAGFSKTPEFWGRYLNNVGPNTLTTAEVAFLRGNNCRILPIYKVDFASGLKDIQKTEEEGLSVGARDATRAIAAAQGVGLTTPGVYIYADIEWNFQPSADWFMGWFTEMNARGFGGGVYCTPTSGFFTPGYCAFVKQLLLPPATQLQYDRMLWANLPQNNFCSVHQQSSTCNKDLSKVSFKPDNPPCDPLISAIWQVATNCLNPSGIPPPQNGGIADQDLCDEDGWDGMWAPPSSSGGASPGDSSAGG